MKKATCFGSGVIGSGWATTFLLAGLKTTVYDLDQEKLDSAKSSIENNLKYLEKEKVLTREKYEQCINNLVITCNCEEAVRDADLIQENGPENINIKISIINQIEKDCRKDAIIASSTSGLLVSDIAANAKYPERIIGAHPYNPVHLIPLIELSKGDKTSDDYLDKAISFYKAIKKEPIVLKKEALGFISNRLQVALYREAVDLVQRGVCTMEEVDRAVCYGPGLRYALMGPNMIFQLGGGKHGLVGTLTHIGKTVPLWWKNMASWTEWPEGYIEKSQEMMNEAMAMRPIEHGRTSEEIAEFRDKGLIKLLQYHDKL